MFKKYKVILGMALLGFLLDKVNLMHRWDLLFGLCVSQTKPKATRYRGHMTSKISKPFILI